MRDFFKYAKDITNNAFSDPQIDPTHDKTSADNFYYSCYSRPVPIDPAKLFWFPQVQDPTVSFNLSGYRPSDIKKELI